ncbi:hypothetical protein [Gracilimonas sp.]|uniref:hypothetical protein n=1 Tax=Gracilimonas sp. TaxID=1974203 RepID=UPI003D0CE1B1
MHTISRESLLSLTLIFLSIFLLSCKNEAERNEFIIGYAGTFDLHDVTGYATIQSRIEAYNFKNPDLIRSSINEKDLGYFRQDIEFAYTIETFTVDEGILLELEVEYNGRKTTFSDHIMPELSYDKILLDDQDTTSNEIELSWNEISGADYYSIDIESTYYNSIVWDTVVVNTNSIMFNKDFFQSLYGSIKVNITAIKGPLPNEKNYYNLDGGLKGRFLLISGSYVRTRGHSKKSISKTSSPEEPKLVIENILNRYQ